MPNAFKNGILTGLRHWKLALLVYVVQLLLAGAIGLQVYHVLEASIGNSLEVNKLLRGYDNTVFLDLLNVHGASISPLVGQLRWLLLIYAVFSIFINGGILASLAKNDGTLKTFWQDGAANFFPFLKVALATLLAAAVWSVGIWLPFLQFFPTSPEVLPSEKTSVLLLLLLAVVWFLGIIFLFNGSVVARLKILREKSRVRAAMAGGFQWGFRRFFASVGLVLLFTLLQFALAGLYLAIEGGSGMVAPMLVWVFVLVQQAFVFLRIVGRVMLFAGLHHLYVGPPGG